ncbi:AraC family transcriptional regulator [Streptomyces sp. NPDC047023]|uniref:helix-turn-helix transcriptional regulator n=1 Tax=Streptomyces sp. NPDC047023 TaxID=3155139 RepID=UPI0033FC542A
MSGDDGLSSGRVTHEKASLAGADAVAHAMNLAYPMGISFRDLRPEATMSVHRIVADGLCVDGLRMPLRYQCTVGELPTVIAGVVRSGTVGFHAGDLTYRVEMGAGFVPGQPGEPYAGFVDHAATQIITIDAGLPGAVCGLIPDDAPRPLRFLQLHALNPSHDAAWSATCAYATTVLTEGNCTTLVVDTLRRMLAATLLTAFPNSYFHHDPLAPPPGQTGAATLKRAIDFIEAHAERPLTLADIAGETGVTGRALQYAFRHTYDTTPMAYLRRVRLHRARRELLAANLVTRATVAQVAARWGWAHPGRFTQAFKREFGIKPSTVQRQPPRPHPH